MITCADPACRICQQARGPGAGGARRDTVFLDMPIRDVDDVGADWARIAQDYVAQQVGPDWRVITAIYRAAGFLRLEVRWEPGARPRGPRAPSPDDSAPGPRQLADALQDAPTARDRQQAALQDMQAAFEGLGVAADDAVDALRYATGRGLPWGAVGAPVDPDHMSWQVAAGRAEALLQSLLSPDQRAEWATERAFTVRGSAGGLYRVCDGGSGNVEEWAADRVLAWCVAPRGGLPVGDKLAAQLLHLRHDEPGFRRVANRLSARPWRRGERWPGAPEPAPPPGGIRVEVGPAGGVLPELPGRVAVDDLFLTFAAATGQAAEALRAMGAAMAEGLQAGVREFAEALRRVAGDAADTERRMLELQAITGATPAQIRAELAAWPGTLAEFRRALLRGGSEYGRLVPPRPIVATRVPPTPWPRGLSPRRAARRAQHRAVARRRG